MPTPKKIDLKDRLARYRQIKISGIVRKSGQTISTLQDVSLIASDGSHLQAWFARPASVNGDAVILFHGVGDNREGMMGFAELFLANGFAVLVPDSRAQGESGGPVRAAPLFL